MRLTLQKNEIPPHLLKFFKNISPKPKDDLMIPHRVYQALMEDGWYGRSAITWIKNNPMPESVRDRPTSATEMIFLLAKQPRYFYDADAIAEQATQSTLDRNDYKRTGYNKEARKDDLVNYLNPKTTEYWSGTTRNRRNWWVVNSQPYSGAHFATWPEKLVEPMVLAGSSPRACEVCGAPWERVTEREGGGMEARERPKHLQSAKSTLSLSGNGSKEWAERGSKHTTTGWRPTCAHDNEGAARCIVLDPFAGSGTTLRVAERYGRDSIGIDLGYLDLAEKRTDGIQIDMESLL